MSVVKAGTCNLTKYVKVGQNQWRHCPVVRGSTGRVRPDHVLVGGRDEVHPEGYYSIDWYEDGKRRRISVGKNAARAQQAQERQTLLLGAKALGIAVEQKTSGVTLADACAEFLEETRQQRTQKTLAQYKTALEYFQASCPAGRLQAIERQDLMRYMGFLAEQKHLAPRTIWTKIVIVVQMLKANGITNLLKHRDWPRFVEKVPQAYTGEELRRFLQPCNRRERVLFEFFLGTGFREKEVQYAMWKDISFQEHTARVTAKTRWGFIPKTWEEREVLIPDHLVESLRSHKAAANPDCPWVFSSSTGCVAYHFLDECKRIAWRAGLNCGTCHTKQGHCHRGPHCAYWFLHKFRSTYATNQLRAGTDIRTLQVWMGHKDLASTMRYLKAGYGKDLLAKVNAAFEVIKQVEEPGPGKEHTSAGAASLPPLSDRSAANCRP
jgi:integrase/recombinase XerD